MYNIHSHYENILSYANSIVAQPTVIYLHPFGSTQPQNIEALQNGGFGPLIIAYDQEPLMDGYNDNLFSYINNNFFDDDGYSRPTILLNTEKTSQEKTKILEKYNYHDVNYFFHGLAAADWYRGYYFTKSIIPVESRQIKKKFISFNRITGNARVYRSFFVAELAKRNLLAHGHISYSDICPVHGSYHDSILSSVHVYNVNSDYAIETIDILNHTNLNLRIDSSCEIPNGSQTIGPIQSLIESFLHVVTETCFWDHRTHLTEKIFKPITAKQPFVLIGCAGNLEYLRSYGFKTFNSWWDEGYDAILDPIKRLQAVVDIVQTICSYSNKDLQDMYKEMKQIIDYNYNLFYSQQFVNSIWHEMTENLKSSILTIDK